MLASDWPIPHVHPPGICHDTEPCEAPLDYGWFSSIGIQTNHPIVTYYDKTYGNLMLAARKDNKWTTTLLDGADPESGQDTGDVGRWPSLIVNGAGNISVAYFDATQGALRYASAPQGQLQVEVVDHGIKPDPDTGSQWNGIVGAFATLTTDTTGLPTIYYMSSTDMTARKTTRVLNGWSPPENIPNDGAAGFWLDAAKLHDGQHILACERWHSTDLGQGRATLERRLWLWFD